MSRSDDISNAIAARGIVEVLHFTTNRGLVGIVASKCVKSRARLSEDQYLEAIFTPNARNRRDSPWVSYVNLSVSRINLDFFRHSSEKWHGGTELWWPVLAFDPQIMTHDGVVFTTTNNIYTGCRRGNTAGDFENMFADEVLQYSSRVERRPADAPSRFTTCVQAEVLYPEELSTEYLSAIYVGKDSQAAVVEGQLSALRHRDVPVLVRPTLYGVQTI